MTGVVIITLCLVSLSCVIHVPLWIIVLPISVWAVWIGWLTLLTYWMTDR